MDHRFTVSTILAIEEVMSLFKGKIWRRLKGWERAGWVEVEVPFWCNFHFFSRIVPTPIRRVEHLPPREPGRSGVWRLEREIEFYHAGTRVAVVRLEGLKVDGARVSRNPDNASFWGVVSTSYLRYDGCSETEQEWRELEYADYGVTSFRVA